MAILEIPVTPENHKFSFKTTLDSVVYSFEFYWVDRANGWFMDVSSEDETPIVTGIKIVCGSSILEQYKHLDIPKGTLIARNNVSPLKDPERWDFGTDVILYYLEVESG